MPEEQDTPNVPNDEKADLKAFLIKTISWNKKAFEIISEEVTKPAGEAVRDNLLKSMALTGKCNNDSLLKVLSKYHVYVEKTEESKTSESVDWLENLYKLTDKREDRVN